MKTTLKLCIITTHPIQYMAPWFRSLTTGPDLNLSVVFFRELNPHQQGIGFGQSFQWDVPLRQGYDSHVLDVPTGLRHVPTLVARLGKFLSDYRPDAILITGWNEPGLVAVYPLAKAMGIPIILRGESNILRNRSKLVRGLHPALLCMPAAILVIGKANREFYRSNGVSAHRLFEGVYFVESSRMLAMSTDHAAKRPELRSALGYTPEDFVFCFSGKHVPFKRPMLMIEAAAVVRRNGWPVKLHFSGSGDLTAALRHRAEELSVPIHFTGFLNQTEMWKAYVPADAFVLPSTNGETWGLVTNEAMLFGLPAIVSDQVGCGPDLIVEGATGYTFEGGAEGLAQAMEKMLLNRHRSGQMGLDARQRVLEHYSMDVATRGLLVAMKAVCS